jgi:hypothetical protein
MHRDGMETVDYAEDVEGTFTISPPLNAHETDYLQDFAATRHMLRRLGPYYLGPDRSDIIDSNAPGLDQPSLWCHWEPVEDGGGLVWNGSEKFRYPEKWLAYLLGTFLAADSTLSRELTARSGGRYYPPSFGYFTFNHEVFGTVAIVMEDGFRYQIQAEGGSVSVLDRGREFQV